MDVRSLLRRKDRGVFFQKEDHEPAQVIADSAFYKLNLQMSERKLHSDKGEKLKIISTKNRRIFKTRGAPRTKLVTKNDFYQRPSTRQSLDSQSEDVIEVVSIHDEQDEISYAQFHE